MPPPDMIRVADAGSADPDGVNPLLSSPAASMAKSTAKSPGSIADLQAEFDLRESASRGEGPPRSPASPPPESAAEGATADDTTRGDPTAQDTRLVKLVNNQEGYWKVLEDGRRIDLTEEEWRMELARVFKRES